jgi:hypothetical protein
MPEESRFLPEISSFIKHFSIPELIPALFKFIYMYRRSFGTTFGHQPLAGLLFEAGGRCCAHTWRRSMGSLSIFAAVGGSRATRFANSISITASHPAANQSCTMRNSIAYRLNRGIVLAWNMRLELTAFLLMMFNAICHGPTWKRS